MKHILTFVHKNFPEVYGCTVFVMLLVYWQFQYTFTIELSASFAMLSIAFMALRTTLKTSAWQRYLCVFAPALFMAGGVLFSHGQTTAPIKQLDGIVLNHAFTGNGYARKGSNVYTKNDSAAPNSITNVYHVDGTVYRVEVIFDESKLLAHQKNDIRAALKSQYGHRLDFSAGYGFAMRSDGNNQLTFDGHRLIAYNVALNTKWYETHLKQITPKVKPKTKIERIISG